MRRIRSETQSDRARHRMHVDVRCVAPRKRSVQTEHHQLQVLRCSETGMDQLRGSELNQIITTLYFGSNLGRATEANDLGSQNEGLEGPADVEQQLRSSPALLALAARLVTNIDHVGERLASTAIMQFRTRTQRLPYEIRLGLRRSCTH